jgi:hypothetical protein
MDKLNQNTKEYVETKDSGYSSTSDHHDTDIKVESLILSDEDKRNAQLDPELQKNLKSKVKIKLVIAEVAQTTARKNFRTLISPILSKFDVFPEFGMFHSAIIIGPWLLEWKYAPIF